jgi:hypothetical protein
MKRCGVDKIRELCQSARVFQAGGVAAETRNVPAAIPANKDSLAEGRIMPSADYFRMFLKQGTAEDMQAAEKQQELDSCRVFRE